MGIEPAPEAGCNPAIAADFGAPAVSTLRRAHHRPLATGCDYIIADRRAQISIRRARPNENNSFDTIVQAIADNSEAGRVRGVIMKFLITKHLR